MRCSAIASDAASRQGANDGQSFKSISVSSPVGATITSPPKMSSPAAAAAFSVSRRRAATSSL